MFALAALVLAVSLPAARVEGSGPRTSDARKVPGAPTALVVKGPLHVTVSEGAAAVTVTAEKNLQNLVVVEVVAGALHIHTVGEPVSPAGVVVAVRVPSLRSLTLQGAVHCTATLDGAADVELSGASEATLKGKTTSLDVTVRGAGVVNATAVVTNDVRVTVGGAASVDVGSPARLAVSGSGVGKVRYRGSPQVTSKASRTVKVTKVGS